ncbi:hypothetical protein E6H31_02545 [Candidatus Bathyarchaeota archaeon]|nr:MAG: hypothetical protein E6H31_02545 [Candidatus Bathyarchaeota archaeon]
MLFGTLGLTKPVLATSPDFTMAANPGNVSVSLGYWAETMLTITSLDSFEGTIQLDAPVGPSTGLVGAGFSTGMTLTPNGSVSTDLQLIPGTTPGNYDLNITATVGSLTHYLVIPVTVSPVSGPDFTTRLWGSYSTLQDWDISIQEQLVSLGGFKGQVTLSATVTPNIPNAPAFSFLPSTVDLSAGTPAGYTAIVSTTMSTPVGNYIVAVTATNGTISHVYQAIMMVGDYRPQSEQPGPGNSTSTGNRPSSNSAATNILLPFGNASSALSTLRSFWWLQTIIGFSIATLVVYRRRLSLKEQ